MFQEQLRNKWEISFQMRAALQRPDLMILKDLRVVFAEVKDEEN